MGDHGSAVPPGTDFLETEAIFRVTRLGAS